MRSDNIVPWSEYAKDEWARMELSWTAADPLTPDTDDEPWRYTPDPAERPEAVIVWMAGALALLLLIAIVVAAWRR